MSWMIKQLNKKNKGFTLIEMVVVLAIIAVLIAIAVPQVLKQINNAKKNADIANAKAIATAIMQWVGEGNTITSGNWKEVKDDDPINTPTGNKLSNYITGGLPKVKYNSNWTFYYRYANDTLYIGVHEAENKNYVLYPEVTANAQKDDGTEDSSVTNPYK